MSLSAKLRRAPLRAVTGAFILGGGIDKLSADEETARNLHGLASGTYGFLGKLDPKVFAKALGAGEIALGGALLLPVVSPVVAGLGLMGFSGGLLNMYWNTPGMHEEGSPKPTQAGVPIAKDVWMFGMGAGLVADGILSPAHDKHVQLSSTVNEKRNRKAKRKARKAAKKARAQVKSHAMDVAKETQADLTKRARKAAKNAAKRAKKSDAVKRTQKVSNKTAKRLGEARDYSSSAAKKTKQTRRAARRASHRIAEVASEAASITAERAQTAGAAARGAAQQAAGRVQHAVR